jgi:hypothetical protein
MIIAFADNGNAPLFSRIRLSVPVKGKNYRPVKRVWEHIKQAPWLGRSMSAKQVAAYLKIDVKTARNIIGN